MCAYWSIRMCVYIYIYIYIYICTYTYNYIERKRDLYIPPIYGGLKSWWISKTRCFNAKSWSFMTDLDDLGVAVSLGP